MELQDPIRLCLISFCFLSYFSQLFRFTLSSLLHGLHLVYVAAIITLIIAHLLPDFMMCQRVAYPLGPRKE